MRARRLLIVSGFVALLVVAPAAAITSAMGAGAQRVGCPSSGGWNVWSVAELVAYLELPGVPPSMDGNNDGRTCVKFHELANGRKGRTAVIYADNDK